jgi:ABC-type polysaccharide/polyol phosphate export permease
MISYFRNLIKYRYLLVNLAAREIKSRYKQSILGYFWIILNPFFQMLVMTFVFSFILKIPSSGTIPYPLFLYSGLLPWTLFVTSLSSSTTSLVDNSALIKKIYFPREIIITATTIAKIYDFLLASIIFILFLIFYHVSIPSLIIFLPLILLIQIFFSLGISFFLSAGNLFYRDVQYLINLIILIWFYLTPIIYPVELAPQKARFVFQINPMSVLINAQRRTIFGQGELNYTSLLIALGITLIIFELGYIFFKKLEGVFADVV